MGFTEAISSGFSNYATFSGRSSRSAYWYWVLFVILADIVALIVDGVVGSAPVVYSLVALALVLPGLAVGVRRLHDSDKSAWNLLWVLIPFLGSLYMLYLLVQPSSDYDNDYGASPA